MFGYILIDIVSNDSPQASRAGRASRAGDALEAAHSSLDEILDQKHTQCLHTFDPFHFALSRHRLHEVFANFTNTLQVTSED